MNYSFFKNNNKKYGYIFTDTSLADLTQIRKILLTKVPCFAPHEIDIKLQSKKRYLEEITERISLVPLYVSNIYQKDSNILGELAKPRDERKFVICSIESQPEKNLLISDLKIVDTTLDQKFVPEMKYKEILLLKKGDTEKIFARIKYIPDVFENHARFQVAYGICINPISKICNSIKTINEQLKISETEFVNFDEQINCEIIPNKYLFEFEVNAGECPDEILSFAVNIFNKEKK